MKSALTHRSPVAWLLYALILFSGLACSIGHGQMLASMMSGTADGAGMNMPQHSTAQPADLHAGMDMDMGTDTSTAALANLPHPSGSMSMMFGDCTFAGTVTLALSFFLTFGWLLRRRPAFLDLPRLPSGMSLRDSLPARQPQAP